MFFRKQNTEMRCVQSMNPVIFLPLVIAIIIAIKAFATTKGSIVILENPNGTGFMVDFKDWSAKNKCELSLYRDDVLQVEIARKSGEIALTVSGKNGSEPYTGNNLKSGIFTLSISETDEYVIRITGKDAAGKIIVKNLGKGVK